MHVRIVPTEVGSWGHKGEHDIIVEGEREVTLENTLAVS
jgi:hypothetical protein